MKFHVMLTTFLLLLLSFCSFAQSKPNMMANVPQEEASFSEDDLRDYYLVYQNKAVKHVRAAADRYSRKPGKGDDETLLLTKVDKAYLAGRFNVLSQNPDLFGNTHILLISVDKPDKVFKAIVYTGGDLRLDYFQADSNFNDEDMRIIRIRYRKFLVDTKHSL